MNQFSSFVRQIYHLKDLESYLNCCKYGGYGQRHASHLLARITTVWASATENVNQFNSFVLLFTTSSQKLFPEILTDDMGCVRGWDTAPGVDLDGWLGAGQRVGVVVRLVPGRWKYVLQALEDTPCKT